MADSKRRVRTDHMTVLRWFIQMTIVHIQFIIFHNYSYIMMVNNIVDEWLITGLLVVDNGGDGPVKMKMIKIDIIV